MWDPVHLLSLLSILATGFNLALGVYLLHSNSRAALNRVFFAICLSFGFWSFGYTFLPGAATTQEAFFWFKVSAVGWTLAPALLLHFCILLVKKDQWSPRPWVYPLIYAPAIYFLLRSWFGEMGVVDFVATPFGWSDVYGSLSPGYAAYLFYFPVYILIGLLLVAWFAGRSEFTSEKRQAQIIVLTGLPVLLAVAVSGILLPWMGIRNPPEIAHLIAVVWTLVIWNSVTKYKLMAMSPASVAPNILATMADAVVLLGRDHKVVTCNAAARRLFGISTQRIEGMKVHELLADSQSESAEDLESFLLRDGSNLEISFDRADDTERVLRVSTSQVTDLYNQRMGEVLVFRDVSAEKKAESDLRYMATHDALTDLPNRSLLQDRLERALNRAEREGNRFAVLMFDLDDFKQVNDEIDHEVGDLVLRHTARRLTHCVRGLDTVCRLGGDEFLVIVEDLHEFEDADIVAQRILHAFQAPIVAKGQSLTVAGSIGISTYPADGDDVQTLVKKADLALNSAKQGGRATFQFFSPDMEATNRERVRIERGLQQSLQNDEMFLVYQPLFDFASGEIAGVEALIRWKSSDMGLLSPLRFIPVAERSGLIVPIGEWVIRTACRQNREWQDAGLRSVPISVNVSARQLRDAKFVSQVETILRETGLEPEYLEIELTESATMEDLDHSLEILTALSDLGVRLVIDDFGTGYSSLARLRQLPIDGIKVDRSFIEHIAEDSKERSLVMAIVAMASNLGLQVVAEGVETFDQLRALGSLEGQPVPVFRCDRVQGFLFSRPVGEGEVPGLFERSSSDFEPFRSIRQLLHESAA
jgi:diguanylate cyclase (GGDEF)-like protein/PAS domain S-box-containing protein